MGSSTWKLTKDVQQRWESSVLWLEKPSPVKLLLSNMHPETLLDTDLLKFPIKKTVCNFRCSIENNLMTKQQAAMQRQKMTGNWATQFPGLFGNWMRVN